MNKLKGLKEDLNKAIRQLAEAQAEGIETRSLEERVEQIRDEIVAFEDEIRMNTITITDEVNNKGVEKMENNKEFRQALKSGENLAEMEVRSHHIMGTVSGGSDFSAQRKETLQQQILRKMGDEARIIPFINFKEQNGKVRIPISSNKGKVAKVPEGENLASKDYQLSYKVADTVKYAQMSVLTNEFLEDSDVAIQTFVTEETARDFARTLEEDFLKGNIPGKVEGVAVCETAKTVTLAGDEITVTDLKKAYFSLPVDVRNAQDLLFITDTDGVLALDCLEDANGRALLQPAADPQMAGKYFNQLYNAKVLEVEATALPVGTVGVFVSPSLAVHAGLARTMNINVDHSKRSEYDETVVLSSL